MPRTIQQSLRAGGRKLQVAGIKSATLDATVIIGFVLQKSKEYLFAHPENFVLPDQTRAINKRLSRRALGCPVAYLTNQKEFFGLDFFVDKRVLIPRPKTELLVEETLNIISANFKNQRVNVADIGTGSGCLAITLAKRAPNARLFAVDVSARALSVAKRNAKLHGVTKKINFYRGDLLLPLRNKRLDIVIANLPYLRPNQIKGDIRFEPRRALVGGHDGLKLLKKLFQQITKLKYPPPFLILEIDRSQMIAVRRLAKKLLPKTVSPIIR